MKLKSVYETMPVGQIYIIPDDPEEGLPRDCRGFLIDLASCLNEVFKPNKYEQSRTDRGLEIKRTA